MKKNNDRKEKQGNQAASKNTHASVNEIVSLEYDKVLEEVGRPLSCVINLDDNFVRDNLYTALSIKDMKTTVSYMMDNRAVSYKTLTHALLSGDKKYGLACGSDGSCELFELVRDKKARTKRIAKTRPAQRIMDPMFAFVSDADLYIVFNIPTQTAIDSGVKGRKPMITDEGCVLASGAPFVVHFQLETGEVSFVSPRMMPMSRYVCSLIDEPNSRIPLLLVANVLTSRSKNDESAPTMKKLLDIFLDDSTTMTQAKKKFPSGISVLRIEENAKFVSVPMNGSKEFFIESVVITPSKDGDNNIIKLCSYLDRQEAAELDELIELAADVESSCNFETEANL